MSATSAWAAAREVTLTIGGGTYPVSELTLDEDYSTFDATNLKGDANAAARLAEEIGLDTVKTSGSFKVFVDKNSVQNVQGGRSGALSWSDPAANTHGMTIYITKRSRNAAAKGGFMISCSFQATGLVSGQ